MRRVALAFRGPLRRFLRDSSATTAAEFALVIPVFLLLIFGTINTGIALSAVNQIHFAAQKAARCMSVDVGTRCSDPAAYAAKYYLGPTLTGLTFTPTANVASCGNRVVGRGSYQLISGFSSTTISLAATACYPKI